VEITFVGLAFVLVGFVIGRWPIVLLAIPFWIVLFVGAPRGWWGEEENQGEFAEYFLGLQILVSGLVIAAGGSVAETQCPQTARLVTPGVPACLDRSVRADEGFDQAARVWV
jgi:hypothetical protein